MGGGCIQASLFFLHVSLLVYSLHIVLYRFPPFFLTILSSLLLIASPHHYISSLSPLLLITSPPHHLSSQHLSSPLSLLLSHFSSLSSPLFSLSSLLSPPLFNELEAERSRGAQARLDSLRHTPNVALRDALDADPEGGIDAAGVEPGTESKKSVQRNLHTEH